MPNTSATGGVLVETETAFNVERFFHGVIMGLTGIDKTLIRPRWQPNAPIMPANNIDWIAFGVSELNHDATAYTVETEIDSNLIRHESYAVLCSFYGPNAQTNYRKMRDGLEIGQNRDSLFVNKMGYTTTSKTTHAPELVNDVWFDRYDAKFEFAREVIKSYNIFEIESAHGSINTETLTFPFNT